MQSRVSKIIEIIGNCRTTKIKCNDCNTWFSEDVMIFETGLFKDRKGRSHNCTFATCKTCNQAFI